MDGQVELLKPRSISVGLDHYPVLQSDFFWIIDVLGGAMIVLAVYALNLEHPGMLLGSRKEQLQKARVRCRSRRTNP
jgi:hypothetical protein